MSAYICSSETSYGMHKCVGLPRYKEGGKDVSALSGGGQGGGQRGLRQLEPVLQHLHHGPHQPLPRGRQLRQHRPGLGGDLPGDLPGGVDGRHVLRAGQSLLLELDILRLSDRGIDILSPGSPLS